MRAGDKMVGASGFEPPTSWSRIRSSHNGACVPKRIVLPSEGGMMVFGLKWAVFVQKTHKHRLTADLGRSARSRNRSAPCLSFCVTIWVTICQRPQFTGFVVL